MKLQKTLSLILVLALVLSMVSLPVAAAQTGNAQTGAALEEAAQTETAWDEMELTGAALDGAAQTGETLDRTALTGEALDGTMLTGAALDGSTSGGMDRDEMGVTEEDLAGTILAGEAASYAVGGLGSYYAEDGTTLLGTVTPYLTAASAKESEEFKFYAVPEQGCELTALSAATADGETAVEVWRALNEENVYSLTMPAGAVEIHAQFRSASGELSGAEPTPYTEPSAGHTHTIRGFGDRYDEKGKVMGSLTYHAPFFVETLSRDAGNLYTLDFTVASECELVEIRVTAVHTRESIVVGEEFIFHDPDQFIFRMPDDDVILTAKFRKDDTYSVDEPDIISGFIGCNNEYYDALVKNEGAATCTLTPGEGGAAKAGQLYRFKAEPIDGYTVKELTVTTDEGAVAVGRTANVNEYCFTMPDRAVTIRARFSVAGQNATENVTEYDYVRRNLTAGHRLAIVKNNILHSGENSLAVTALAGGAEYDLVYYDGTAAAPFKQLRWRSTEAFTLENIPAYQPNPTGTRGLLAEIYVHSGKVSVSVISSTPGAEYSVKETTTPLINTHKVSKGETINLGKKATTILWGSRKDYASKAKRITDAQNNNYKIYYLKRTVFSITEYTNDQETGSYTVPNEDTIIREIEESEDYHRTHQYTYATIEPEGDELENGMRFKTTQSTMFYQIADEYEWEDEEEQGGGEQGGEEQSDAYSVTLYADQGLTVLDLNTLQNSGSTVAITPLDENTSYDLIYNHETAQSPVIVPYVGTQALSLENIATFRPSPTGTNGVLLKIFVRSGSLRLQVNGSSANALFAAEPLNASPSNISMARKGDTVNLGTETVSVLFGGICISNTQYTAVQRTTNDSKNSYLRYYFGSSSLLVREYTYGNKTDEYTIPYEGAVVIGNDTYYYAPMTFKRIDDELQNGMQFTSVKGPAVYINAVDVYEWELNYDITVSFDANGGRGRMEPVHPFLDGSLPVCKFIAPQGHDFSGWLLNGQPVGSAGLNVTEDITLTASWASLHSVSVPAQLAHGSAEAVEPSPVTGKDYTVRLTPDENYRLASLSVKTGDTDLPVIQNGDLYTFTMPNGDVRVKAVFVPESKTLVTFLNWDGAELDSQELYPGETPVYQGESPTRGATAQYSYSFNGWDREITPVPAGVASVTYTATYTAMLRSYTVRFIDYDGTQLQSGTFNYGDTPVYTADLPEREPENDKVYLFSGWDSKLAAVTGDKTYTAVYAELITLSLGNTALTLPEDEIQRFAFTPTVSDDYRFRSESDIDTWVKIYDGGTMIAHDYDSGGNWQFDCITALQGGKTYEVDICSPLDSGDANVCVTSIAMYNVTVNNSDSHGTINPENLSEGKAYAGQEVQFSNEADEGYMLTGLTVTADGQSFEAEPFGFVMIDADVTVTPHFGKTYAVTVNTDEYAFPLTIEIGGLMFGAENAKVPAGAEAKLLLIFEDGYMPGQIIITAQDGTSVPCTLSNGIETVVTFTMPEQDVDIEVSAKPAGFVGHSLSLNGDIGVNFYIALPEEIVQNATVSFAWIVDNTRNTATVDLKDAAHEDSGYRAICHVAPAEMTCPVTATLTYTDKEQTVTETDVYSAKQYADVILTNESFAAYYTGLENAKGNDGEERLAQLRTLVADMLHYGAAAQAQFTVDTEHPADTGLDALPAISTGDIPAADTDMTANLSAYGLEYRGSTLVCRTTTLIRHYYKIVDPDKFDPVKNDITIGGAFAKYKERDDEIYFEIADVAAADLDTDYTLKIGTNEYKYSAMDYAKHVLQNGSEGTTIWDLVVALYWYNQAANAYFGR